MLSEIRNRTPDWLWAGIVTFTAAFVPLFAAAATGWWESFIEFFTTEGARFPSLSILVSASLSAAAAAIPGALNAVYRFLQERGVLPGSGPEYPVA